AHETNATLRKTIEDATASAWPRLLRIAVTREAAEKAEDGDASAPAGVELRELHPEEVLRRRYQRWRDEPSATVPEPQLALLRALVEQFDEEGSGQKRPPDSRLTDAGGPP